MSLTTWIKRRTFSPPKNLLGGDLFWWRESPEMHTLVSIHAPVIPAPNVGQLTFTFVLFDGDGVPRTTWRREVETDEAVIIDSAHLHRVTDEPDLPEEGTLAVFVSSSEPVSDQVQSRYHRLYSLVDWYSDDGEMVSLHNDQTVIGHDSTVEFTEIAFLENQRDRNFLVLINGGETQAPDSISLTVKNSRGDTLTKRYLPAMKPYSLHKLRLEKLFPDLRNFCGDEHASLTGEFNCRGLYVRPYVMTQGRRLSGYHGGDRYDLRALTRERYESLGRGEVNPMAVVITDELHTFVNLFNTHGDLEEDFWVDARVYDEAGTLVADRSRWLLARRNRLARGALADLLPDDHRQFIGHIALSFSPDDRPFYPSRLQALMEYRTKHNTRGSWRGATCGTRPSGRRPPSRPSGRSTACGTGRRSSRQSR